MTVQSTVSRADYIGNGATTAFAVPFYFLEETDLEVILQDNSYTPPLVTTLVDGPDYTVSGAGSESGGSVTLALAPTAQQQLTILRDVDFTQLTVYTPNDPFPAASHEQALDKATMLAQQLSEQASRALTLPPTAGSVNPALPSPQANGLFSWDPTGTFLQYVDPVSLAVTVAQTLSGPITFVEGETPSGLVNGTNNLFSLAFTPVGTSLRLYLNGVRQKAGVDYALGGNVITMTTAPSVGDSLVADYRH